MSFRLLQLPTELFDRIAEVLDGSDLLQLRMTSRQTAIMVYRVYIAKHFHHRRVVLNFTESLETALAVAQHPQLGPALKMLSISVHKKARTGTKSDQQTKSDGLHELFVELHRKRHLFTLAITDEGHVSVPCIGPEDPNIIVERQLRLSGLRIKAFGEKRLACHPSAHILDMSAFEVADWKETLLDLECLSISCGAYKRGVRRAWLGCESSLFYAMLPQLPALEQLVLSDSSFLDFADNGLAASNRFAPLSFPRLKQLTLENWTVGIPELLEFIRIQPSLQHVSLSSIQWFAGVGNDLSGLARSGENLTDVIRRTTGIEKITVDRQTNSWIARIIQARLA